MEDSKFVYWCDMGRFSPFIHASPINITEQFRDRILHSQKTVIMTSATLSTAGNFDYLKARLGIEDAMEQLLPSPFDFSTQTLFYLPRHLPEPTDKAFPEMSHDPAKLSTTIPYRASVIVFPEIVLSIRLSR